jgi:protein TonB
MASIAAYRSYELPWTLASEQEQAFRRWLRRSLGALAALTLLLALAPTPEPAIEEFIEIPPRFARLLLEREPPPPPPPILREEPEPVEPLPVDEPEPAPPPERVVETRPEEAPRASEPAPVVEEARERARSAGLLPFAEQLAALRNDDTLDRLDAIDMQAAAGAPAPVVERSLITSRVGAASGGINTAALSRNTGGGGLGERTTTQVENPVAEMGMMGAPAARSGSSSLGSRSREEIELVFDRNKGAIYALYNRALRENPALEGKLVLKLTIAPDGAVTACEVVSSELGDPDLEQKLVQRVLLFRFEAKDVEPVTTTKPIDFFPA